MVNYRYLIYKLYSWGLKNGDTPVANVIITLSFVHYVQLFTVYMLLLKLFPGLNIYYRITPVFIFLILIVFGVFQFYLFYNKKRWAQYIDEYGNESKGSKRKGTIIVLAYLIGSILLFFVSLPLLFGF
jgi:hypothetical protein